MKVFSLHCHEWLVGWTCQKSGTSRICFCGQVILYLSRLGLSLFSCWWHSKEWCTWTPSRIIVIHQEHRRFISFYVWWGDASEEFILRASDRVGHLSLRTLMGSSVGFELCESGCWWSSLTSQGGGERRGSTPSKSLMFKVQLRKVFISDDFPVWASSNRSLVHCSFPGHVLPFHS